jgi:hypothetical protein
MYREYAYVDAYAISRATGARAVAATWSDDARHWFVVDKGLEARAVVLTHEEDGRWVFHQVGEPETFEDTTAYVAARGGKRLTADSVMEYLHLETSVTFGQGWAESAQGYWGLERSLQDLREPVLEFRTLE